MLRFINDTVFAPELNMAFDEMLFSNSSQGASLRVYGWSRNCATIGYFQENIYNPPAVRRLTGGLFVNHGADISYGFAANANVWPFVYNQNLTYKNIHSCIKNALAALGVECSFAPAPSGSANNICVETVYDYDLMHNGKKIAGSCQRRRGKTILVQGSVHLALSPDEKNVFAHNFAKNLTEIMKVQFSEKPFTALEIASAQTICENRYALPAWNFKHKQG
jgi:lipoate-protein ligase A